MDDTDDLSAQLNAAFDQAAASEPAAPEPAAEPTSSSAGPARDEGGRFARRESSAVPGEPSGSTPGASPDSVPDSTADSAPPSDPDAPEGWTPELWSALTPEARRHAAEWAGKQRETLAEREARLKQYEPLDRVLANRRDALTAQFGGVDQALDQLFHLSDWAGRDPVGFMRYLAEQRGIAPQQLVQALGQQQAAPAAQPDPAQQIQSYIAQQVQQGIAQARIESEYAEFQAMTALEHRNDPEIQRVMAGLLTSGAADSYKQAYDLATKAHPTIGPKLAQAQAAAQAKAEAERRAKEAREKASAAVSVTGAPGTARPAAGATAPNDLTALLNHNWDRLSRARV